MPASSPRGIVVIRTDAGIIGSRLKKREGAATTLAAG